MVRAGRAAAWLAPGISVGAARDLGRADAWHFSDRTAADAAARAFLADPVRQGCGRYRGRSERRARLIVAPISRNCRLCQPLPLENHQRETRFGLPLDT